MGIEVKNINYSIKDYKILQDINLKINQGEILTIMGPNGSGKSSLIKILAGDFPANNGSVIYDNKELNSISLNEQAKIRSVMSQSQEIAYDYTVKEIIEMGWIENKLITENNLILKDSLKKICEECNTTHLLNKKYNILSGGEKRNVNFARALIQVSNNNHTNKYLILDEPTANLDIAHKMSMMDILCKKKTDGFGIIIVLHDLNLAYKYSDKIGLMKHGKLIYYGKTEEVFNNDYLTYIYDTNVIVNKKNKTIKYY